MSEVLKTSFVPLSDSLLISNDDKNQLEQIYEIAKNKDIVAIGEVTHGTYEILQIQKIITQKLIERDEYSSVVLGEVSLLQSYEILDFVLNERGRLEDIEKNVLGTYDVSELIKFVAKLNKGREFRKKVWVIGSDICKPIEVIKFIEQHIRYNKIENAYATIENLKVAINKNFSSENANLIIDNTNRLMALLRGTNKESDSLSLKVDFMIESLSMMLKMIPTLNNFQVSYEARDSRIFENILWINKYKPKTVIIRAHNYHINKKTLLTNLFYSSKTMGELLSNKFGDRYYNIGTETQKGSYFTGVSSNLLIKEDSNKLGSLIGNIFNNDFGIIYLADSIKSVFNDKRLKLTLGTAISEVIDGKGYIGDSFDALFYIKKSTPFRFYNNTDFFNLFIHLDSGSEKKFIEEKEIKIKTKYTFKENSINTKFCYTIYLNDSAKNLLKSYYSCLDSLESAKELTFEIPQNTFFVSIGIQVKKTDWFKLQSVTINSVDIKLKNISFHDWNEKGYKFNRNRNGITVYK